MAEDSRITNVEGELGVASEVTMRRLLEEMKKMARSSGRDPNSQEEKIRKNLRRSMLGEIEVRDDLTDSLKIFNRGLGIASLPLKIFSGATMVGANVLGKLSKSAVGFGDVLFSASNSLADFTQHIPVVGGYLAVLAKQVDDTRNNFSNIATVGADFAYDMGQFRLSAREAGLELSEYTSFIRNNAEQMASFGGTLTRGAMQVSRMVDSNIAVRENLLAMGLNFEEINESMAFYQYLNRAGARTRRQDDAAQAEAAASLTKNMLTLSKLTGKDIQQAQQKIAQEQMDMAFQMELNKLDEDERKKMNIAMAEALATGGEVAVNALKAEFLGMPPLTRELQLFAATQGESFRNVQRLAQQALDGSITVEEFQRGQGERMADYLSSQVRSAEQLQTILRAGAAGAEGLPAELSSMLNQNVDTLAKYFKDVGGSLVFARNRFLEDYEAGKIEVPDDSELEIMSTFLSSLARIRKNLQQFLINPLVEAVSPAFGELADLMKGMSEEGSFFTVLLKSLKPTLDLFGKTFENIIEKIKNKDVGGAVDELFRGIGGILKSFMDSPAGQALSNNIDKMITNILNGLRDAIFGKITNIGGVGPDAEYILSGGLIESLSNGFRDLFKQDGVISALTEGVNSITGSIVKGFTDFWKDDESQKMRDVITDMFKFLTEEIILSIAENTPFMGGAARDITRRRIENKVASGRDISPEEKSFMREDITARIKSLNAEINKIKLSEPGRGLLGVVTENAKTKIGALEARISKLTRDLESFSLGSGGFRDFGSGTLAVLHGREAVVREDSEMGQLLQLASANGFDWGKTAAGSMGASNPGSRPVNPGVGFENRTGIGENISGPRSLLRGIISGAKGSLLNPWLLGAKLGLFAGINPGMQDRPRGFDDHPFLQGRPNIPGLGSPTGPDTLDFGRETAMGASERALLYSKIMSGQLESAVTDLAPITSPRPMARPNVPTVSIPQIQEVLEGFGDSQTPRMPPEALQAPVIDSIDNLGSAITSFQESSNRTGNTNTELQKKLNTTMDEMKVVLRELRDINKRIETNTRSLGTNVSSGYITSIR